MTNHNNFTTPNNVIATRYLTAQGYSYVDSFRPYYTSNGYYSNQSAVDHGGSPDGRTVRYWNTCLTGRQFHRLLADNGIIYDPSACRKLIMDQVSTHDEWRYADYKDEAYLIQQVMQRHDMDCDTSGLCAYSCPRSFWEWVDKTYPRVVQSY